MGPRSAPSFQPLQLRPLLVSPLLTPPLRHGESQSPASLLRTPPRRPAGATGPVLAPPGAQAANGEEAAQRALRKVMRSSLAREAMGRMRPRRTLEALLALHTSAVTTISGLQARTPRACSAFVDPANLALYRPAEQSACRTERSRDVDRADTERTVLQSSANGQQPGKRCGQVQDWGCEPQALVFGPGGAFFRAHALWPSSAPAPSMLFCAWLLRSLCGGDDSCVLTPWLARGRCIGPELAAAEQVRDIDGHREWENAYYFSAVLAPHIAALGFAAPTPAPTPPPDLAPEAAAAPVAAPAIVAAAEEITAAVEEAM